MSFEVKDSDKGILLPGHRIFACAYEPYWQQIRMRCRFKEEALCLASLSSLTLYIQSTPRELQHEMALRRWRVLNMLNAVPLGLHSSTGLREIEIGSVRHVKEARTRLKKELDSIGYPSEWDWAISRRNTYTVAETDEGTAFLMRLVDDYQKRRIYKGKKIELRYYINILEEVLDVSIV